MESENRDSLPKWTVTKLTGGSITGEVVKFVEFDENERGKEMHDEPMVGRALIVDPHPIFLYKWMTTPIESIEESIPGERYKFNTKNSTYIVSKNK